MNHSPKNTEQKYNKLNHETYVYFFNVIHLNIQMCLFVKM